MNWNDEAIEVTVFSYLSLKYIILGISAKSYS